MGTQNTVTPTLNHNAKPTQVHTLTRGTLNTNQAKRTCLGINVWNILPRNPGISWPALQSSSAHTLLSFSSTHFHPLSRIHRDSYMSSSSTKPSGSSHPDMLCRRATIFSRCSSVSSLLREVTFAILPHWLEDLPRTGMEAQTASCWPLALGQSRRTIRIGDRKASFLRVNFVPWPCFLLGSHWPVEGSLPLFLILRRWKIS